MTKAAWENSGETAILEVVSKILVVDDDRDLVAATRLYLSSHALAVQEADDGSLALALARESPPDVILLDVNLPMMSGPAVCRALKQGARTRPIPVIMMSGAMTEEKDILIGLESGADDYILKPFSQPILLAKINAQIRRARPAARGEMVKKSGIQLDPEGRTVTAGKTALPLSRKEFDLLHLLMRRVNKVHSPSQLLEAVWGYDPASYNNRNTVEVHVYRLRRKLGPLAKHIVRVSGVGYKFDEHPG